MRRWCVHGKAQAKVKAPDGENAQRGLGGGSGTRSYCVEKSGSLLARRQDETGPMGNTLVADGVHPTTDRPTLPGRKRELHGQRIG